VCQATISQGAAPFRGLWAGQREKIVGEIPTTISLFQRFDYSMNFLTVDDIQGTGCVAQAAIKAAIWVAKGKVSELKMIVFGAGTAGTGIR
jgi:malic enzyme